MGEGDDADAVFFGDTGVGQSERLKGENCGGGCEFFEDKIGDVFVEFDVVVLLALVALLSEAVLHVGVGGLELELHQVFVVEELELLEDLSEVLYLPVHHVGGIVRLELRVLQRVLCLVGV